MRKMALFSVLLFSAFSYGQLRQTKLTDNEIDIIGKRLYSFYRNTPDKEEIQKLGLRNIVEYIADFTYNGKTIATVAVGLDKYLFNEEETYYIANRTPQICFSTTDLSSDILLALLKENNWKTSKPNEREEFICNSEFGGKKFFSTEDNGKTYKTTKFANGKIDIILYKLEK